MILKNTNKIFAFTTAVMLTLAAAFPSAFAADGTAAGDNAATVAVAAETAEARSRAVFSAEAPDKDGFFKLSLTLYDTEFLTFQFGVTYDPEVVTPVDIETGEPTEDFEKFRVLADFKGDDGIVSLSEILQGGGILKEESAFSFTAFFIPSASRSSISTGSNGYTPYTFRFKRIKDGNPGFALMNYASKDFPKLAIIGNGMDNKDFDVCFELDESFKAEKTDAYTVEMSKTSIKEYEYSDAELRTRRVAGSVYLNIDNYAAAVDGKLKWVDGGNKNVYPFIENDRTYVPLRFISEAIGAKVDWAAETGTITLALGESSVVMTVGSKAYTVNDVAGEMDVTPIIREDRTFVPVRFISEALNKSVYWSAATRSVIVTAAEKPWDDNSEIEKKLLSDFQMITSPLVRDYYSAE